MGLWASEAYYSPFLPPFYSIMRGPTLHECVLDCGAREEGRGGGGGTMYAHGFAFLSFFSLFSGDRFYDCRGFSLQIGIP